ncbi:MAG TPA: hypothetical protein VG479_02105 [Gaiellaceae bacterium]|jgi:hypothetical protein|nr:hypothetical protein [Gaiellaceae bacterium]
MRSRGRHSVALLAALVVMLVVAGTAAAEPALSWSGTRGPFAWEAQSLACGVAGVSQSSRLRAHTRWRTSPADGYQRLTFLRQIRLGDAWITVQRDRRTTRNTALEGYRSRLVWSQWFGPRADAAGTESRHAVLFEWLRDRPGPDPRLLRRVVKLPACRIGSR